MSQSESSRRHYLKNKKERLRDNKLRLQAVRDFVQEYKRTHPCAKCGEPTPCCLDFHHKNPKTKAGCIPVLIRLGWSIARLKIEIAKCEMLCANCHRKETFGVVA